MSESREVYESIYTHIIALVNEHGNGDIEVADKLLTALHSDYSSFGIECISEDEADFPTLLYLNMGDTYDLTICVEEGSNTLFLASWGAWYEEKEREYCEENNEVRCSWCGSFTDMNEEVWSDVICGSCGNLVGG